MKIVTHTCKNLRDVLVKEEKGKTATSWEPKKGKNHVWERTQFYVDLVLEHVNHTLISVETKQLIFAPRLLLENYKIRKNHWRLWKILQSFWSQHSKAELRLWAEAEWIQWHSECPGSSQQGRYILPGKGMSLWGLLTDISGKVKPDDMQWTEEYQLSLVKKSSGYWSPIVSKVNQAKFMTQHSSE